MHAMVPSRVVSLLHRVIPGPLKRNGWRIGVRDEKRAEALGTVALNDEVLSLENRVGTLARGGLDRDWAGRICNVGRAIRRVRNLEEHVGHMCV
jgi:hypothetical protein